MAKKNILFYIRALKRPIFTTHELSSSSGKSTSVVTQSLNYLESQGIVFRVYRGIWAQSGDERLMPCGVIPFLFPRQRAYISFISALHMHGIVEQIPQTISVAATSHTKMIRTKLGTFSVHQIAPSFFKGFDWYKDNGSFLIAEPEKALIDCLYLSSRKKKYFAHFPELYFPKSFSFRKARLWANSITNSNIRANVIKKLEACVKISKS